MEKNPYGVVKAVLKGKFIDLNSLLINKNE